MGLGPNRFAALCTRRLSVDQRYRSFPLYKQSPVQHNARTDCCGGCGTRSGCICCDSWSTAACVCFAMYLLCEGV